jgi:hypothetical protein
MRVRSSRQDRPTFSELLYRHLEQPIGAMTSGWEALAGLVTQVRVMSSDSGREAGAGGFAADFRLGWAYLQRGLAIVRRDVGVYLRIVALYAAPALLAAYLSATRREPNLLEQSAMVVLPWVTAVLGTVVVMIAISYHARSERVGLSRASWEALPWMPRYLWTNVHTSLIFWLPIGLLLGARAWQEETAPLGGLPGLALAGLWWLALGSVAVCLHTRTILAPFLAVHSDLPGTLATLESWRLSGNHFAACLGTLVIAGLPIALLLGVVGLGLATTLSGAGQTAFLTALPNLTWAGIQAVRPVLIPAVYALYVDLWQAESDRRRRVGAPPVPALARALLMLTRLLSLRRSNLDE